MMADRGVSIKTIAVVVGLSVALVGGTWKLANAIGSHDHGLTERVRQVENENAGMKSTLRSIDRRLGSIESSIEELKKRKGKHHEQL